LKRKNKEYEKNKSLMNLSG
jgi:hypothetical protein